LPTSSSAPDNSEEEVEVAVIDTSDSSESSNKSEEPDSSELEDPVPSSVDSTPDFPTPDSIPPIYNYNHIFCRYPTHCLESRPYWDFDLAIERDIDSDITKSWFILDPKPSYPEYTNAFAWLERNPHSFSSNKVFCKFVISNYLSCDSFTNFVLF
jgi:hypothetical protein